MKTLCMGLPIAAWLMIVQLCLIGSMLILLIRKARSDKELASEIKEYVKCHEGYEENTNSEDD